MRKILACFVALLRNRSSVINQTSLPGYRETTANELRWNALSLPLSSDKAVELSNDNWMKFRKNARGFVSSIQKRKALLCDCFANFKCCFVDSFPYFFPKLGCILQAKSSGIARFLFASRVIIDEKGMFLLSGMRRLFCMHRGGIFDLYRSLYLYQSWIYFMYKEQTNIRLPFSGIIDEKLIVEFLFFA